MPRALDRLPGFLYDTCMARAERRWLSGVRAGLLQQTGGTIVEIGAGTGANLPHYPRRDVTRLDAVEPSLSMIRRLERRTPRWVTVHHDTAEDLPFEEATFDYAVGTLVFCTVPDASRGFGEIRRVLKPGGRLVFLEHVRSSRPRVARWQERIDTVWPKMTGGCHASRDTVDTIEACGFEIEHLAHRELDWRAGFIRDFVWGVASVRAADRLTSPAARTQADPTRSRP
ncbi:MAG: class I SAM-dependent methyltransferase [Acidimicrobiia bacterium]|nr:class I SAM-dependent methyltransferase [Acidimicrobiia bacterium]